VVASLQSCVRLVPRTKFLVGVLITTLALGSGILMTSQHASGSPSSSFLSDPRLIIHPMRTTVHGVLSNGTIVTGSLSPTIPGKNFVQLVLYPAMARAHRPATITLEAAMLGMRMLAVRAVLPRTGSRYAGSIVLPMFGTYRVSVGLHTAAGMQRAIITLELPLPRL